MADYFEQQPNFTNPSYATPEQLASQRAYAEALMKQSNEKVNRPTGALANVISALTANLTRNNATQIQQQAAEQNASDLSSQIAKLKEGGPGALDPEVLGRIYANPMAAPEHRALVGQLLGQAPVTSAFGQPGYQSPIRGIQPSPIQGPGFQPGAAFSQSAGGASQSGVAPAPAAPPTPPAGRVMPMTPTNPNGGVYGGLNFRPADNAPVPSPARPVPAPSSVPTPGGTNVLGGYQGPMGFDQLAAKGRELTAKQGVAETQTGVQKEDMQSSANAPVIKRVAGTMLNDLEAHGDKMTFGPTAEWTNNVKRLAANYAPGLMKDQLEGLASADSFDKMSAQLTGLLAKGGGTDAQLFNNMKSVPGSHNSKEGARALLQMTMQVADQQQALRQTTQGLVGDAYEKARNDFYAKNPIVNPITGNPIKLDLETAKSGKNQMAGPVSVASPEEARKLPKGTPIRLPDGRTGVVP